MFLDTQTGSQLAVGAPGALIAQAGLPTTQSPYFEAVLCRQDGTTFMGTNSGVLIEVTPEGKWIASKVSGRSIETLALTPEGDLLIGGQERNLRVLPLD
jgi:hypothetical protein